MRTIHPKVITGILASSGMVGALNGTLVIPLIPVLPSVLDVTSEQSAWLITITLVAGAVMIPAATRLADMLGRRLLMILCLLVMGVGAVLSAASSGYTLLFLGRALAGFGAPLIPIGIAVLRDSVPREKVGTAVALMSATTGIGAAIGLPLAGLLFETLGWRWVFIVTAVASLGLAALVALCVPGTRTSTGGTFDFVGAVILAVVTGSLMILIAEGGVLGWRSPAVVALALVSSIGFFIWILVEIRVPAPLVDLRVSTARPVLFTNIVAVLVGIALLINLLLAMQQLQAPLAAGYGLGLGVLDATLVLLPSSLLLVFMAPLSGYLLNRIGGQPILVTGLIIMGIGYVFRIAFNADAMQILLAATVVTFGSGLTFSAMPVLIMRSVPVEMTAAANGLNALVRQIGTSISSAVVTGAIATNFILVGGVGYPTWESIVAINGLAVGICVIGAALGSCIPRRS